MKRYITHNLDEAAFLVSRGLKYRLTKTGCVTSTFRFDRDKMLERYRREFWSRGAKVNIHTWLAVRGALKNELSGQSVCIKEKGRQEVYRGGFYYFIDEDRNIQREIWGFKNPTHQARLDSGNFYKTKEAATKALTACTSTLQK